MIFVSSKLSDGNMSIFRGDVNQANMNKLKFFQKRKINPNNVIELQQVHGNKVIRVNKAPGKIAKADGLITNQPDIYLMIKAADCHQIGFYDPKNKVIGLVHAGYKGLEKGIIKNVINSMKKSYRTNLKDLIINFGPSIGPCHYRLDIWTDAENQLIKLGILKNNINNPHICTYESKDYFSHRRAEDRREKDFRFITIIGLNNVN